MHGMRRGGRLADTTMRRRRPKPPASHLANAPDADLVEMGKEPMSEHATAAGIEMSRRLMVSMERWSRILMITSIFLIVETLVLIALTYEVFVLTGELVKVTNR